MAKKGVDVWPVSRSEPLSTRLDPDLSVKREAARRANIVIKELKRTGRSASRRDGVRSSKGT